MTQMTRSSILMNNIPNWQRGSCSGRPPDGTPPLYHRGVSLTLARNSDYSVTKLPDLRETINQARGARVAAQVPVQSVAPMQLPFTSVRDLDCQHQLRHDQTLAK